MKKIKSLTIISFLSIFFFLNSSNAMYSNSVINLIKPDVSDIPAGYRFGIIPQFAKNMLKDNPWDMDQNALSRFAHRIYPDADHRRMSAVHMTIIANEKNPYDDDIVCYIFLYKDKKSAEAEIEKLTKFVEYNNDRGIVLSRENLAVYLLVDHIKEYRHIDNMSKIIQKRIDTL